MMEDPEKLAKSALDYTLANSSSEALKSYVERGRQLKAVPDDELLAMYRNAFTDWSKSMFDDELLRRFSDMQAELELRGIEPPSEGLEEAVKNVAKDLRNVFKDTDASALTPLIEAYRDAVSKKQ